MEILIVFLEVGTRWSSVRGTHSRELVERTADTASVYETGVDVNDKLFRGVRK